MSSAEQTTSSTADNRTVFQMDADGKMVPLGRIESDRIISEVGEFVLVPKAAPAVAPVDDDTARKVAFRAAAVAQGKRSADSVLPELKEAIGNSLDDELVNALSVAQFAALSDAEKANVLLSADRVIHKDVVKWLIEKGATVIEDCVIDPVKLKAVIDKSKEREVYRRALRCALESDDHATADLFTRALAGEDIDKLVTFSDAEEEIPKRSQFVIAVDGISDLINGIRQELNSLGSAVTDAISKSCATEEKRPSAIMSREIEWIASELKKYQSFSKFDSIMQDNSDRYCSVFNVFKVDSGDSLIRNYGVYSVLKKLDDVQTMISWLESAKVRFMLARNDSIDWILNMAACHKHVIAAIQLIQELIHAVKLFKKKNPSYRITDDDSYDPKILILLGILIGEICAHDHQ